LQSLVIPGRQISKHLLFTWPLDVVTWTQLSPVLQSLLVLQPSPS